MKEALSENEAKHLVKLSKLHIKCRIQRFGDILIFSSKTIDLCCNLRETFSKFQRKNFRRDVQTACYEYTGTPWKNKFLFMKN